MNKKLKVAIIGAGVSGLTIASRLGSKFDVKVFEKSRGAGGRMSTRRDGVFHFDHGTQCFTARTKEFTDFITSMQSNQVVHEWTGKVINLNTTKFDTIRTWSEKHFVATPNMNSLCKYLAEDLNVEYGVEITKIHKNDKNYQLFANEVLLDEFNILILTCPPEQVFKLAKDHISQSSNVFKSKLQACFATMIGFEHKIDIDYIAAKVHNSKLKWISVNSTKPCRDSSLTTFVLHSKNNWAEKNIDKDIVEVQKELIAEFERFTKIKTDNAAYLSTHRWRYSIVEKTLKKGPHIDHDSMIYASSDWCYTSRIEEVWISANQLCEEIMAKFS